MPGSRQPLQVQCNILTERSQRQSRHLEMLFSKRYANNSYEQQGTEHNMHEPRPQAAKDNPQNVERNAYAAGR